jgi:hypothetical protein
MINPSNSSGDSAVGGVSSFVDLCSFVAIRQTQHSEEVLRQLLLYCLILAPEVRFTSPGDFAEIIESRFGLKLPEHRLQSSVDTLLHAGQLVRSTNRDYGLSDETRQRLADRIAAIKHEEEAVRTAWAAEIQNTTPKLPVDKAWSALTEVLRRLFRRHGLQTLSLIEVSALRADAEDRSIRADISEICKAEVYSQDADSLESCILGFIQGVRADQARASFIAHLADSTVSYYSLTVSPDVAARLRAKLLPLDIFLDTDVLFGLIGLAEPETTDIARELAAAVGENQLPLTLRFHEGSEAELRRSFSGTASNLRARYWPPAVSRAAARVRNINTVMRLYHERNAESAISPDSFLAPYEHVDIIIRERGAVPYREAHEIVMQERYDLLHDYTAYLMERSRQKPYETLMHDVTLLSTVRRLRVAAKSSLEARALLVTNDVMLHLFEARSARQQHRQPCTVMPRQLLQLLRPFIPSTPDFDRSFAETFSAAEFRSIDGRAASATGKLIEILAAYKDLTEETASAMLANDMLLGKLQAAAGEDEIAALVESALAAENASLQAERDTLAARIERHEGELAALASKAVEEARQQHEAEMKMLAVQREEAAAAARDAMERAMEGNTKIELLSNSRAAEQAAREAAEREVVLSKATASELTGLLEAMNQRNAIRRQRVMLMASIVLAALLTSALELTIRRGNLPWVADHEHTYGLRLGTYLLCACFLIGLLRSDLRKGMWIFGCLPALFVILQLL